MKKIFAWIVCCVIALVSIADESKQYGSTQPGETYFVKWTYTNNSTSAIFTNKEAEMWYPSKVKVHYTTAAATTTTLDHITVIPKYLTKADTVTTNDDGLVVTNHFHGSITNTTYTYLTNRLCTITNTASANQYDSGFNLTDEYIRYGDILLWTLQDTNGCWLGITGKR